MQRALFPQFHRPSFSLGAWRKPLDGAVKVAADALSPAAGLFALAGATLAGWSAAYEFSAAGVASGVGLLAIAAGLHLATRVRR